MSVSIGPMESPDEAYRIRHAEWEHSRPDMPDMSLAAYRTAVTTGWPGRRYEHYIARLDDVPAGLLQLDLPQLDNLATIEVELKVLPSARRRGVGGALFELAVERARAEGRKHLIASTDERHPDGAAFARSVGAVCGLEEVRGRLDLKTTDRARLEALLADARAHAADYRLIRWTGVPPDEIIADVAYLDSRFNSDAPVGDLAIEPERTDAEQIREGELNRARRGQTTFHTGAMHGDRLVAWTMVASQEASPHHAWQNITLVDPPHRGHRLGLLVKLANLEFVRESRPELEVIDTFNAASNEHMLRINREMGFRPVDSLIEWQLTL